MRLNKLLVVATSALSLACGSLTDPLLLRTEIIEVAPNKVVCQGSFFTTCLSVRRGREGSWQAFYGDIEGFVWGEGFYYVLEVRVYRVPNPPADGSSEQYRLKRLVSRTSGPMP